ncbi:hypothetical protein C0J52_07600 [Blattella germanica]|nr:hypothetical protein C0J52_07600 [Blattella germanica]
MCFHLNGAVNSQNTRIWASENPHNIHEIPLHDVKIGVWCASSQCHIIGPIFVETTVDTAVYMEISSNFVNHFDEELHTEYFQQDGSTCYISNISMKEIESFFEDRIISNKLWALRFLV